jgi:hypothetical protein
MSNSHSSERITEDELGNLFGSQGASLGLIDPFAGLESNGSAIPQENNAKNWIVSSLDNVHCRLARLEEAVAQLVKRQHCPTKDGLSMQILDDHCQPIFDITPQPTNVQINAIMRQLDEEFPALDRRQMQSQVKKWFRKRRERASGRIITAFNRIYGKETKSQKFSLLEQLDSSETICDSITKAAEISFTNHGAKIQFCRDKIKLHLSANKRAY